MANEMSEKWLRSFQNGLSLGLCGKALPWKAEPVAWLYNGVEYPVLPNEVSQYPCAVIVKGVTPAKLLISAAVPVLDQTLLIFSAPGKTYTVKDGKWTEYNDFSDSTRWMESGLFSGYIKWANVKIVSSNGTVIEPGTDSVPPQIDGYLYNGVRLPKLPEWDKSKYPYAKIHKFTGGGYGLRISAEPCVLVDGGAAYPYFTYPNGEYLYSFYTPGSDNWTELEILTGNGANDQLCYWLTWANHDIVNPDGSVYLPASEPVPVYE